MDGNNPISQTAENQQVPDWFRRNDWQQNQLCIQKAFVEFVKAENRPPTHSELAEKTGLNHQTIANHPINLAAITKPFMVMAPAVLAGLAKSGMEGNPIAVKTFFQLVCNWSEKQTLEHLGDGHKIDFKISNDVIQSVLDSFYNKANEKKPDAAIPPK